LSSGILLIVGLGNPGAEYRDTRHNAGAWFVEALAKDSNVSLRSDTKFHGLHSTAKLKGYDVHLLIPTTYMNLSGQSVKAVASYYKIPPEQIIIVHDELDLPPGEIKLKLDGGHGGHNGLRDIIRHLNTNKFYRLRIGIGHPGHSNLVHDFVLNAPKKAERELINNAMQNAEYVVPLLLEGEYQKAMQELHTTK
jgi:PTH1 family peptidyl-tRNA hydrolase